MVLNVTPQSKNGRVLRAICDDKEDGKEYYAIDLFEKGKYVGQVGTMTIYPDDYGYAQTMKDFSQNPSFGDVKFYCEGTAATVFPEFARLFWEENE